jgi:signal transduction histidine kinase
MRGFVFAVVFFCPCFALQSQEVLSITDKTALASIGQHFQYFEDKTRNLTLSQVVADTFQQKFKPFLSELLSLGASKSALWLKIQVRNQSAKRHYIFIDHVSIDSAFIYFRDAKGSYQSYQTGRSFPQRVENIPPTHCVLPLLSESRIQTYYIRIATTRYLYIESYLIAGEGIIDFLLKKYMLEFIYFGIILFAFFYNLFVYLSVKDISYLYYIIYTFLIGISLFFTRGYTVILFPALAKTVFQYNYLIGLFYNPFVTLFTISFLRVRHFSPALYAALQVLLGLSLLQILLSLLGFNRYLFDVGIVFLFFNRFFHVFVGVVIYFRNYRPALYYLLSWGIFTLMTAFAVLSFNNFLPVYSFTEYLTFSAVVIETIICSLALADRINVMKKETQEAHQKNFDLIRTQKETLEGEVKKRTFELEEKNQEITTQNEELHQQKQEIEFFNNQLEDLVNLRTQELRKTLDDLTRQNQDLEQFSYIISHNLRAPVARIIGLMSIFSDAKTEAELQKQLMGYLQKTTLDLDTVIKDLTQIISIRNDLDKTKEHIDVLKIIEQQQFMLQNEIEKSKAMIVSDSVQIKMLHTVKSYLQSILYNLLSNAIKYKSEKRIPVIQITTTQADDFICLSVQDNGIGMDLTQTDTYKIFGLYQRLHDHVEGKGLGLFLTKTQIDSLGGRIEVTSKLDVGTIFQVYFPL